MFHVKHHWLRAARFCGLDPDDRQMATMSRYHDWLRTEGIPAGGLGPGEGDRIDLRHLADAVLFASVFPGNVATVWDLGTGVGLPGIPLAICLPEIAFTLIDRSRRRTDLTGRALRILDLENCQVVTGEISDLAGGPDVIVSRASLPPDRLLPLARSHLEPGGVAVVGGSWRKRPRHHGWTTTEIPPDVLDQTVWLLIMRAE